MEVDVSPDRMPGSRVWTFVFRSVLLAVGASTVNGVTFALARKPDFLGAFPGATPGVFGLLLAAAAGGLLSLIGLWLWQRWALWLFMGLGLAVIPLDLLARAPRLHMAAATLSTLLILGLAYPVRARFRVRS